MTETNDRNTNIFRVDTRFQQMARRPGGVARESAIDSAQRHIDGLKTEFVDWLDRELQELAGATRQISPTSLDAAALERAYYASCQLRDVGGTMGYELITFIANNFCNVLDAIRAGAPCDKDMIDCHMDALLLARTEPYRHLRPEQVPEMTSGLRRVVELASANAARTDK